MLSFVTSDQDGTHSMPLDAIGYPVGDGRYSTAWGTGCLTASCQVAAPASFTHFAFKPGRLLRVFRASRETWRGVITEPDRSGGDGWTLNANGLASLGVNYVAVTAGGAATTNPNTAIDAAIARGLPWTRSGTLPTPTLTQAAPGTVSDLLNQVTDATGQRWGMFGSGQVMMPSDPTTPTHYVDATSLPGARSLVSYATRLYGRYQDNATSPAIIKLTSVTTTRVQPFGVVERLVDLTALGPIDATTATTLLTGQLALLSPRLAFTGAVTLQPGQLLTAGGTPSDLALFRAGRLVTFRGISPDPLMGELNYGLDVDMLVGQTDYDDTAGTLQLTPIEYKPRDMLGALTASAAEKSALS